MTDNQKQFDFVNSIKDMQIPVKRCAHSEINGAAIPM